jgi:hypothetical protein
MRLRRLACYLKALIQGNLFCKWKTWINFLGWKLGHRMICNCFNKSCSLIKKEKENSIFQLSAFKVIFETMLAFLYLIIS